MFDERPACQRRLAEYMSRVEFTRWRYGFSTHVSHTSDPVALVSQRQRHTMRAIELIFGNYNKGKGASRKTLRARECGPEGYFSPLRAIGGVKKRNTYWIRLPLSREVYRYNRSLMVGFSLFPDAIRKS